jgi:hypothetical protein
MILYLYCIVLKVLLSVICHMVWTGFLYWLFGFLWILFFFMDSNCLFTFYLRCRFQSVDLSILICFREFNCLILVWFCFFNLLLTPLTSRQFKYFVLLLFRFFHSLLILFISAHSHAMFCLVSIWFDLFIWIWLSPVLLTSCYWFVNHTLLCIHAFSFLRFFGER